MLIQGLLKAHNIGVYMENEEDMDNFSPLQHDLDEYHNDLAEEFADEFDDE